MVICFAVIFFCNFFSLSFFFAFSFSISFAFSISLSVWLGLGLSFFLWGSIPDEELLKLAEAQKLHNPEVLSAQVDRMLRDKRVKRFCDSFPAQWLQLERIITSTPDRKLFPTFYANAYRTSMHMMLEPLLLFETVLIENRPVHLLIVSDFSYRSGPLSNWDKTGKRTGGLPPTRLAYKRESLASRRAVSYTHLTLPTKA